ncbi:hypothetical protein PGTUg99_020393 [Puccinia graminis f. sp. tritici]|uniref:Uncharacterized protein n=1 Tax=Puccinia graminis f. sp. tritici TaxID=56615 RepID=A0A5B0MZI9_PUCGR|nr:hypothetical protein PGTUg99_020393 [Puccinia graminis f. sp. tritici]
MSYRNQPVPINLYSSNIGQLSNNLPLNPGPFRDQNNVSENSSSDGPTANPAFRVVLPAYNPEPFGRKPVKIKSQSKGLMFNGTNMDISDFIKRLEYAAQIDGALGSDIALQIIFFLEGETLVKEVQEMAEKENHDWEKLKERMVLRWGKMMPLLKHTRNDLDQLLATTRASGIKTQREFQNFRIKIDNLVAYLVRCQHMGKAEEIRHAVLNCLVHPIKVSVTKELIRDNQMRLSVDGSHILPPYLTIMEYISRELKTISILEGEDPPAKQPAANQPAPPRAPVNTPRKDPAVEELTKTLAGWNVQKGPVISASHVPYRPAQYERPPSTLKCHYCFGDKHTVYRCSLFAQDEFDKKVYREGKDLKLPNGTIVQPDRSRAIKEVVDKNCTPSQTPGIINLPPGTEIKKQEPTSEIRTSYGKLEECTPEKLSSYDVDAAKRLRSGKEVSETPAPKKTRKDSDDLMDVEEEITELARQDNHDLFPGYKEHLEKAAAEVPKKVQFKKPEVTTPEAKEKVPKKTYLEKTLSKEFPEAEERVVQRMVLEGKMELSYGEIFAISNGVSEAFKKKISRRKVPIEGGPPEKVAPGIHSPTRPTGVVLKRIDQAGKGPAQPFSGGNS